MPKRTYQPKRIPRKREHGFMKRMMTRTGRAVIAARRLKGRHALTVSDEGKFTQKKYSQDRRKLEKRRRQGG